MKKIVKFFEENKAGKVIGSIILGALHAFPLTSPFTPAIKQATIGMAGKDKHDYLAYLSYAVMLLALLALLLGKATPEQVEQIIAPLQDSSFAL